MKAVRFLRGVFFPRSLVAAEDRDRRLQESKVRVDHATRLMGNSYGNLNATSCKLHDLKDGFVNQQYVEAVRQLDASLKLDGQ